MNYEKESGITTTSIIIYVISMVLIVGIIATITSFIYTNVNTIDDSSKNVVEITKFHMYFLEETNKNQNQIVKLDEQSILFSSGNTFLYNNNCIYYNNICICKNISNFKISANTNEDKVIIKVLISVGKQAEYSKTTQYVMKSEL